MRHRPWVLLLLFTGLLAFAGPADASDHTGDTVYALSDDDGRTFTVFQRVAPRGLVHVPSPYDAVEVRDQDMTPLHWAEVREGVLSVTMANGTTTFLVTVRGVPGPADSALRAPEAPTGAGRLVVALPEGYATDGLDRIPRDALSGLGLFDQWPLPDDRLYWEGELRDVQRSVTFTTPDGDTAPAPYALLAVLLGLLGLTTLWLMVRVHRSATDPTRPNEMPIMHHLEELRRRLMWIVAVLFVGAVFFFTFGFRWVTLAGYHLPLPVPSIYGNAAAQVFSWISRLVVPPNVEVVVVSPWDAVVTQITIAIALALLVAFPVFFYHVYAFLAPALYPKERRAVFLTVPVVVVLFALGAAFGLGFMLPFLVRVLYSFAGTLGATAFLNVPDLVALGALNAVVFGVAFELPVVMALLSAIGVVPAAAWRRYWRHATLVIVIIAALVTDPTVITQLIVAAVLGILYAIGIVLAIVFEKKAVHREPARPAATR